MEILVTGAAGFVGYHVCRALLGRGDRVVGLDNLNAYYDVGLKRARLAELTPLAGFRFVEADLANRAALGDAAGDSSFDRVIHLAAQAGVRYSIDNPHVYADANLTGFVNVLEFCRHRSVAHLVYASSSSVYGANTSMPFSTADPVDHPVSLYAATKRANELMAHTYSHLFDLPTTGLRLFTVYGPWGRPDMAVYKFVDAISNGRPIDVFNRGEMQRDMTYVDDIVQGVLGAADRIPTRDNDRPSADSPDASRAPFGVYNLGNNKPVRLMDLIDEIQDALGVRAELNLKEMQPGDVNATYADIDASTRDLGFQPRVGVREGVRRFVEWYRSYQPHRL